MTKQRAGDLYALICAVVCALGNIIAKVGLENIATGLFNFYFFLFAFLVSSLALFSRKQRTEILTTRPKTAGLIFIMALLFTFGIYTFLTALKSIEPATVSFLSRIEVIILVFLAFVILKEKLRPMEIAGGLIAIVGVLVLKFKTSMEVSDAATLMIISAFFFAAAEIMVKKNIALMGNARFLFFRNLYTVFIMLAIMLIQGEQFYLPDSKTLLFTFISAMLFPILGRLTFLEAMRRINVSRAILITQITPLFTALFALWMLHSIPTPTEWLGGAIIIAGVLIVKLQKSKSMAATSN